MPEKETLRKAEQDRREGKAPTTQAGEFIREEMRHIRSGKHGARSTKQAIAIGLSKARRAGVKLPPPAKGKVSEKTRQSASRAYAQGQNAHHKTNPTRSRAISKVLNREGHRAGSHEALSRQASSAARKRSPAERSDSARKGQRKRTAAERSASARKAARTRAARA